MDAAVRHRRGRGRSFLPELTTTTTNISNRNRKWRSGDQHRMKNVDEFPQISSKEEIATFRNSQKQSVCVKMLQEGFHRSFSELFSLLQVEQQKRAESDPASAQQLQPEKLETMRLHLCRAEQAERSGSWSVVCEQRLVLGQYFSASEDRSLSLHFLRSCAGGERAGNCRAAAEARACVAELYLQQGELEQARQQAEQCLRQTEGGSSWSDSTGRLLQMRVRGTLWRIYDRLADAPLEARNYTDALRLLHRSHRVATESEDRQTEATAAYRLGLTYQSTGDHDTAKEFFSTCAQMCESLQDTEGLGNAYKAMAKSMESEGNTQEAVQCLEKFVEVTQRSGVKHNLVDACMCVGKFYYTMGEYSRASHFFLQSYEVACETGDVSLLQKAQVWLACARPQSLIREFSTCTTLMSK
ncbi:hypothetical protein JOB18_026212 [Solea senegalensis]|uniref:Tetratricopeptide repeat 29-like isoform X1 n=3 Tax=Solea senegalensis TaxID=28829 RepID=A0AAV6PER2_SOLSE|nr:tetratricopeptide repeat protein 29-like [Solea senegalensis]KAG7461385.1 tetratricopeptide repeat 29-like isoform X1 [Solea senegalensis]KAG7461387.1 hypothetical protein JOB18_026212 [Solea senegalensis]